MPASSNPCPVRALLVASLVLASGAGCRPDAARSIDPPGSSAVWERGREWSLVEEARIGSATDPAVAFSRIVDVAVDALGRVWVADGQENQIRVFEPGGRHVRSIGRRGGGPAEFLGIAGMDWGPEGNLWVLDGGNMRFAVYDTAGRLVATHRRTSNVVITPWQLGFDAQHRLYDLAPVTVPGEQSRTIVRLGPDLTAVDSFRLPSFENPVFEVSTRRGSATHIEQVTVPFAGLQEWRIDPRGSVWVGVTDRYRLERHRFDGGVDLVVERPIHPTPIPRKRRRDIVNGYRDFERRGGRIDPSRIPRTYPVFDGFFFGDDATLWVKLTASDRTRTLLDVFDGRGSYLGQVRAPSRLLISPAPVVHGNRLVGVVQDEDHVESVVVMRIEKPAE